MARLVHNLRRMVHPLRDLRFGLRLTAKNPGFAAVTVLTLALGIGANTAVYSVVRATLLTPLPVPDADRVAMVWTTAPARKIDQFPASAPDYADWRRSGVFEQMGAFNDTGFNLRAGSRTERIKGLQVSGGFFGVMGARPKLGRVFSEQDSQPEVVLSDALWRSSFAADPGVLGRSVVLDGTPYTVVGVLPASFPQVQQEQIYAPLDLKSAQLANRGTRTFLVAGKIRAGVGLAAAQKRMDEVSARLGREFPDTNAGFGVRLQPLEEAFVEDAQALVLALFGAVGFVLLIACSNIANLLLARGAGRVREMAIRAALGAGRAALAWQLLSESVVLALMGGLLGVLPAMWGIDWIRSFQLQQLPNVDEIRFSPGVFAFTCVLSVFTGLLFGLAPAWQVWRTNVSQTLNTAGRTVSGGVPHRLRGFLVVTEIALTLVLLVGAGLMIRSLWAFRTVSPGYNTQNILTLRMALSDRQYPAPEKRVAYVDELLRRIGAAPGVVSAAAARELPPSDDIHGSVLRTPDRPDPKPADNEIVLVNSVTPGYLPALRVPLIEGRFFESGDRAGAAPVALVDEWTANHYWPRQNPIGHYLKLERTAPLRRIVGVVGNVDHGEVLKLFRGRVGEVYLPFAQEPKPELSVVVRTAGEPLALASAIQKIARGLDPDEPSYDVRTLEVARGASAAPQRLAALLLSGFALVALLLAAIGIYGVVAYTVGQRTREIGVRIALGAGEPHVLRLLLRQGFVLALTGVAVGLAGALALTRVLSSLLYGVGQADPVTFTAVALLAGATVLCASYLPARRATRLEPMAALRDE